MLARRQPDFAAGKPEIGHFGLPAVHQLLLEDAGFIKNGIAHGRITLRGKAVQIAGGKPAEAAVAEARVGFTVIKLF